MTRQLNPGLFGETPESMLQPSPSGQGSFSFFDDSSFLLGEFESLQKEFEKIRFEIQDGDKTAALRIDKLIQRQLLIEERLNLIHKELHEKWSELNARLRERGQNEAKIESMIERHNQIVQSFELRISQAQRLIDNQSVQLAKQQQMIDEAKRQIEKLKKL